MAEGKNKIVVYADWLDNFEDLTDVELGKLMRHFFEYVNDLNPELEDRLLKIAWKPIESTLKRDLKKWESFVEKQKANGSRGGRPKTQITQALNEKPKKADSDSDSDSVSDKVSVKVIKDINSRKQEFYNSLLPYLKTYDKILLKEFYDYWTEHGDKDKKYRKEKEKSFNTDLRLKTWFKRSKQFQEKNFAKKEKTIMLGDKMKQQYGIE